MMTEAQDLFVSKLRELRKSLVLPLGFDPRKVAALLRQLLIDGGALVHQANRGADKRPIVKLEFVVNNLPAFTDSPVTGGTHFHAHGIDPNRIRIPAGTKTLDFQKFLKLPILESAEITVNVREIIKFVANLKGGVHFTTNRTPEEAAIEQKFAMFSSIGVDGMKIALQAISSVAAAGLEALRAKLVVLPKSLPLFAHYKLSDPGYTGPRISFDGVTQRMTTDFKNTVEITEGFSFNGVIRVSKQMAVGQRVIYAIGSFPSEAFRLSIWFDGNALGTTASMLPDTALKTTVPDFHCSPFFDNFFHLGVDLRFSDAGTELGISINGRHCAEATSQSVPEQRTVTRHTIGANLDGHLAAAMQAQEIVLVSRPLLAEERIEVNQYLAHEWGG